MELTRKFFSGRTKPLKASHDFHKDSAAILHDDKNMEQVIDAAEICAAKPILFCTHTLLASPSDNPTILVPRCFGDPIFSLCSSRSGSTMCAR
jgi:hypothetical protein